MNAYRRWIQHLLSAGLAAVLALSAAYSQADETITYIHWDAQGSPVAATDEDGNVVWRESYRPYGQRINNETAADPHTRWYTGHPQDPDTGLVYAGARYYDPVIGRFLAIDPVEFQEDNLHSFNRYAYGNNNPYRYTDPDGKLPILVPMAIGVGLELLNLGLEIHDTGSNPCADCVRGSGAGIPGGLGSALPKAARNLLRGGSQVATKGANKSPDFVVSPGGTAFPVPKGATGPESVVNPGGKTTGSAFTSGKGGANGQVDTMRIMDATPPKGKSPGYPNGYIKYENKAGQGVDPYSGRTLSNRDSHFLID